MRGGGFSCLWGTRVDLWKEIGRKEKRHYLESNNGVGGGFQDWRLGVLQGILLL